MFLGRFDAAPTLLLETMQNENNFLELHGVDRAVRSPGIVLDNFNHASTAKALEGLRGDMLTTLLGEVQGVTEELSQVGGKFHQIFLAVPNPLERTFLLTHAHTIYEQVYLKSGFANGTTKSRSNLNEPKFLAPS